MQSSSQHDVATPPKIPTRWLAVVDTLAVLSLVLAVCVFTFGGFRNHIGGWRLSVTSSDRLFALATILIVVRHALVPTPAMPQALWRRLAHFWHSEERQAVWPAFVATRLGVLVAGFLGVVTLGFVPGSELFQVSPNPLYNLPARWDASWYLNIVTRGYEWDGNPLREQNVVFFPAFPTAMRVVGSFLGRHWLSAGLLLALAATFGALIYFYRLARDLLDAERARTAVWMLAAYPFAVYYSAPYTEGFYLLGSVGAFYHASRNQWGRAALWGLFVGLCRPNGFFLALPIAVMALTTTLKERRWSALSWSAAITPLVGVLSFSAYLYVRFGDALVWQKGQQAWGRVFVGVWAGISALVFDRTQQIGQLGVVGYVAAFPYDFMHTMCALFVLGSIWPTTRRFGPAYGLFTAINVVPPLLIGGMMSIGRMSSVLFPAFLWLAAVVPHRHTAAWIAAACVLQGFIAVLFFTWRPVF